MKGPEMQQPAAPTGCPCPETGPKPISGMGCCTPGSPSPLLPSMGLARAEVNPREPGTRSRLPVNKSSTAKLSLEWPTQ